MQEALDRLKAHLKTQRLRSTKQREAILEAFLSEDSHVSVEELYDRLHASHPCIGHATVYRCMSLFVEAGLAKEGRFHEGRARYEPGFDADHHDHLICLKCGQIEEFEDSTIERIQEEIAGSRGFDVTYHRLELYGVCGKCKRQA
ncbi:MAG: transcriptional repressor [Deltaproteobacteria bacterium]|nr:transcriptional repressor [Deltaproteobacteria bacterium]